jgi:hypothetical protein
MAFFGSYILCKRLLKHKWSIMSSKQQSQKRGRNAIMC